MDNVEIFSAKRGEGKTKWLIDRAIKANDSGKTLLYVGCEPNQREFAHMWEVQTHTVCPIRNLEFYSPSATEHCCVFTDELMDELWMASRWRGLIKNRGYKWYITMSQEDFVN